MPRRSRLPDSDVIDDKGGGETMHYGQPEYGGRVYRSTGDPEAHRWAGRARPGERRAGRSLTDSAPTMYLPVDPSVTDEPQSERPARARGKMSRAKRIALIAGLVVALLGGAGTIAAGLYIRSVESGLGRVDAFQNVPEESRPDKISGAMNFLILGSDSRDPDVTGSRTDTIILAHIPADRSSAQLISIPRDTWVRLAKSPDGKGGHDAKINAAFSLGGVPLMVQTVESFTGVRIDHVVLIDFAGFKEIVDALGGVDITVDQNFTSIHPPRRKFTKGVMHMDGETALDYARQRYQFRDGDFARIRHQQQLIKAVLDKAASSGILANPARLNSFLRATADAVTVDQTFSLLDMAMDLRHLRGNNLTFITSPTRGTGRVGNQSVVFADTEKAKAFYDAVRRDAVAEFTALAAKK